MPLSLSTLNCFKLQNNTIVLTHEYLQNNKWKFKKITGTRFAAILGLNKYASPFKAWMSMVGLYKEVMDPMLARVGQVIEPKILDYTSKKLDIKFLQHNPTLIKWDAFKENKIFGGIPDGEPVNTLGNIDYSQGHPMLEIKTSSVDAFVYKMIDNEFKLQKCEDGTPIIKTVGGKKDSWFCNGDIVIPTEYQYQLGLYIYLRKKYGHPIDMGYFAVSFINTESYLKPENFIPNDNNTHLVPFKPNMNELQQAIDTATTWYHKHIETGVSPILTQDDRKWLESELAKL